MIRQRLGTRDSVLLILKVKFVHWTTNVPIKASPLGEGSIENGLLRCPWHGWDFHPCSGKAPGFDDGVAIFQIEEREDGIYVGVEIEQEHMPTISDIMVETMTNWGVHRV